ncbi:MAG: carboxypeptidase-like regulatory domain-containing protein [bacterium]
MFKFKLLQVITISLGVLLLFLYCTKETSGPEEPGEIIVNMDGAIAIPANVNIEPEDLTISFGDYEQNVTESSSFNISGQQSIPGLAMALYRDTVLVMMAVIPNPDSDADIDVDIHSTAVALVFMNPFICSSDPSDIDDILEIIESLSEIDTLVNVLTQKLINNPMILYEEDDDIIEALGHAVNAYFDAQEVLSPIFENKIEESQKTFSLDDGTSGVAIIPSTQKSGHSLTYLGNDNYEITNAYGRWATCRVENTGQEIWLTPNGSMVDFWRDPLHRAWPPSVANFNMAVSDAGDTQLVNVYGYGMSSDADNQWGLLTSEEQLKAHYAGLFTFIIEFCGNAVSVMTNTKDMFSVVDGYQDMYDNTVEMAMLDVIANDIPFMEQLDILIAQKQFSDAAWLITKKTFELIASNATVRGLFSRLTKKVFNEEQLKKFEAFSKLESFNAIGMGFTIGNKVTNILKTAYGLMDANFKTTFKVWREPGEFGNITGYVLMKEFPFSPVKGATVELTGDDANPLPDRVNIVQTDADGGFRFSSVLIGTKSLTVSKGGYKTESVDVVVLKGKDVSVTVELSKEAGTGEGLIVNNIKRAYQAYDPTYNDTLFTRPCRLTAKGIIDNVPVDTAWIVTNGRYSAKLPPGSWWLIASHENDPADYKPDSIQLIITVDGVTTASRPLLMEAVGYFKTKSPIYMEGVTSYSLDFTTEAWTTPPIYDNGVSLMVISATLESTNFHKVNIAMNPTKVNGTGLYDLTTVVEFSYNNGAVSMAYITDKIPCPGSNQPVYYNVMGDPNYEKCDCGIEYIGNIVFTEYSGEVGDALEGTVSAKLAGWTNCDCDSVDTNHDGSNDDVDVTCQIVDLDLMFRLVVGSSIFYNTGSVKGNEPSSGLRPEEISTNHK